MQNYDKVVARRFLAHVAGRLHRGSLVFNVFDNHPSLKARTHKTNSTLMLDHTRTNRRTQILEDLKS